MDFIEDLTACGFDGAEELVAFLMAATEDPAVFYEMSADERCRVEGLMDLAMETILCRN